MKIIVVANVGSSHTLNIAGNLARGNHQCVVYSISSKLDIRDHRRYIDVGVSVVLFANAQRLQIQLSTLGSDVLRVVAIGGHSYGLNVANISIKVPKTLILLGTEVTHSQAIRREITQSYRCFDAIVVPSMYLRNKVAPFVTKNGDRQAAPKIYVAPLGVQPIWESKKESPEEVGGYGFKNYFVTAKAFKWIYGFDEILMAISTIAHTLRETNTGFVFIGGGADKARLQAAAKTLLIEDRVVFHENMSSKSLVNVVDKSITAIYVSEYESFGLSVLETIVRRKKPITYDIPGYTEVTSSFNLSIPVEHNDIYALSRTILACIYRPGFTQLALSNKELGSFGWASRGELYYQSCLGLNEDVAETVGETVLFLNKYDMFELQKRKRDNSGARFRRTYELYRELERQVNLVHICTGDPANAREIAKNLNFEEIDVVYIEHGSIYSKQDRALDEYVFNVASKAGTRVVYFVSDYHALDPTYLISLRFVVHRYLKLRKARIGQRELLQDNQSVLLALPSKEINQVFNVDEDRVLELPPACKTISFYREKEHLDKSWSFVYGGGVGPFYQLQRFLLACAAAGRSATCYIRRKDFLALDQNYQSLFDYPEIKVVFDQEMKTNINQEQHVGVMLMEPIDYIKTSFPVKFFDYLESGIPLLAYENTKIGDLVNDYGLGWVVAASVDDISSFASQATLDLDKFEERRRAFLENNKWADRVKTILGGV